MDDRKKNARKKNKERGTRSGEKYTFGVDRAALIAFALVMLPNAVWLFVALFSEKVRFSSNFALDVASSVFLLTAMVLFIFVIYKQEKPRLSSVFVSLFILALLCEYIAWIFYFCDYRNDAVLLTVAVSPCLSLGFFEIERRNFPALIATALCLVFRILSATLTLYF